MEYTMINCIMASSYGLGAADLVIFVRSARRHWDGTILVVGDTIDKTTEKLFNDNYVVWDGGHPRPEPFGRGRFKNYLPHLPKYDRVFISDMRDVAFQDAPVLDDGLCVTEEAEPIRRENYNTEWVKRHGDDVFERIKDCTILCGGTVWGDAQSLIGLCELIGRTEGSDQGTINVAV